MNYKNTPSVIHFIFSLLLIQIPALLFSQDPGFFLDDWQERTAEIPNFEMISKPSDPAKVTVKVEMDSVRKKVPPYLFGNNAVTWENKLPDNQTAMTDLYNLNPRVLRWPAGSGSNEYFWNASPGQRPSDIPAEISPWNGMNTDNWQMSLDEYYALRSAINSNGSICFETITLTEGMVSTDFQNQVPGVYLLCAFNESGLLVQSAKFAVN